MNVPTSIDYHNDRGQLTKDHDGSSDRVRSPDGVSTIDGTSTIGSTIDGTSTIGSAVSEPTTETPRPRPTKRKTSSRNRGPSPGNGGGSSRGSNRRGSSYRNFGSRGMQGSSVPRPYNNIKRAQPITYSKSVRLSGTGNFSPREVDDKTRAVLADMNDFDANENETE